MNKLNLITLTLFSSLLVACSSNPKQGCTGLPDAYTCKTPTQIYEMTNNDSFDFSNDSNSASSNQEDSGMFKSSNKKSNQPVSQAQEAINLFSKPQFQAASSPMPVLEQPKVLRIWIAPWKDQNETLTWGTYMFTEITPRRWNFGDSVMRNIPVTAPNKADYMSPSQAQNVTTTAVESANNVASAAENEVSNINQSILNQQNPPQPQPEPLTESMLKQNQLAEQGGF